MKKSTKLSVLALGAFLFGAPLTFGQTNISDTPTDNMVELGGKDLYEHGYNGEGQDLTREAIDTVMVTSVMNYFVMPDKNYNAAYYNQTNYAATNLTSSEFEWTIGNGSSFAYQSANGGTSTSPWIKVTWGSTLGATTVTVKETPQGLTGTCESQETEIDVWVISKPTAQFASKTGSECYTPTQLSGTGVAVPIALTIASQSSQYEVEYTVKRNNADYATLTPSAPVAVVGGNITLNFTEYGEYVIEITGITDRIARKCDVEGDVTTAEDVHIFTYNVMPFPATGPIYHVPNMY